MNALNRVTHSLEHAAQSARNQFQSSGGSRTISLEVITHLVERPITQNLLTRLNYSTLLCVVVTHFIALESNSRKPLESLSRMPSSTAPIIISRQDAVSLALQKNGLTEMHWGLRTPQNFHVNARLETADSAPRFRDSWTAQRCLIPANGFYEWLKRRSP